MLKFLIPWIYAPATCRAGETSKRREAHARIPAAAILDSASAGTAAEVQRDDVELRGIFLEEARDRPCDKGVADAVEAVLAKMILARNFLIDGVRRDVRRDGSVKLRIEAGDVAGAGHLFHAGLYDAQCRAIVQGRKITEVLQTVVGIAVDDLDVAVVPSMDDAVAGKGDVPLLGHFLQLGILDERIEQELESTTLALDIDLLVFVNSLLSTFVCNLGWWRRQTANLRLCNQTWVCLALSCLID